MICQDTEQREAIRQGQLSALRGLLAAVAQGNSFYRPMLQQAGLARGPADLEDFCRNMPLTTKEMLVQDQRVYPPYGTNLTYPLSAYSRLHQTSATSGAPLRWLDTPDSWQWMLDNWKIVYAAAGVTTHDCVYCAFSFGPFLGFWTAFEAACQLGCRSIPGGGMTSLGRLEAMRDHRADVLLCTPTYALRLAEVAAAEHFDLAALRVRTIIVAGEPGGSVPAVRERIQRSWPQAAVFDHHGMTEVGPVSFQCPEQPGTLLVIDSSYLAEIIHPQSGRPVPPGEVGELVLTTLGRLGSPLLRYRTGDLVREDTRVAPTYGRHELALRGGILGRTDEMLSIRGMNVYPGAVEEVLLATPQVAEYQVELRRRGAMSELQVRVEVAPGDGDPPAICRQLELRLRSVLNLRVPVTACPPGSLPRFDMKARRWVHL